MNPGGQPFNPYGAEPQPPPRNAREDLNIPSLLLLVFGGLSVLWDMVSRLRSGGDDTAELAQLMGMFHVPEAQWRPAMELANGPVGTGLGLVVLALTVVMMAGAWSMRSLKRFPLAVAACVVAVVPCTSLCCCVTTPVGIWALVVLFKPDVRAQFT